tara:strand:+ start:91 stop:513 length:423 start_codon:yes stop_codon:yes gene_type:complete
VSKKSTYKKIMTENTFVKMPRESTSVISNNEDAFDFFTSKRVFGEEKIDEALPFSSPEAKQQVDKDLVVMSNYLGKASQQVIKTMMDGVKGGKYDAMDLARGIQMGPVKRTHYGEGDFLQQLWNKVRSGFRRYSKRGKLR